MTEELLDAILHERGYRRVPPDPLWRAWLWVAPIRPRAISTKLCRDWYNLTEQGLHILLDDACELRGSYYTDEQRRRNVQRMSTQPHERDKHGGDTN